MNDSDMGEEQTRQPAQQAQQPQPATGSKDQRPTALASPDNSSNAWSSLARKDENGAEGAPWDDARFTAGVVKLYEALLKEPIPEEMLKLVDQIGKQERK